MIFYFSATGNCKYVAQRIAEAEGDTARSMVDRTVVGDLRFFDKKIGIVTPTYNWGLPSVVREFLQKAALKADYLYLVATYGTTPGGTYYFAEKYGGVKFDAFYSVKMPDTWTVLFDLSTPEKVARFTTTTESDVDDIIRHVSHLDRGNQMKDRIPLMGPLLFYGTYERVRRTKHLSVESACVGCGLCAKKCPVGAIEMRKGKPVWVLEKCAMCLGCLHRCPKFAIQYGNHTKDHGQYLNPHVKI